MKYFLGLLFLLLISIIVILHNQKNINQTQLMKVSSSAFANNQPIPPKYTCDGEGINPPLRIENIPNQAKSLVLIVTDTDTPGGEFTHWLLWNIPIQETNIKENYQPNSTVKIGTNSIGKRSYLGPCPPSGVHHYHFKVYALDTILNLDDYSNSDNIINNLDGHIINGAELIGTYTKN